MGITSRLPDDSDIAPLVDVEHRARAPNFGCDAPIMVTVAGTGAMIAG
ncbi:hypothetical protein [Nocardia sp. NPDC058666]